MTDHSPLARRLGLTRAAILHVDDLGMRHAGNRAFLDLMACGRVTCGFAVPAEETRAAYRRLILDLPQGVTHLALHCTMPGDIEAIAPEHAGWRLREHALLAEGAVAAWCREAGIAPIGYRAVQPPWATPLPQVFPG